MCTELPPNRSEQPVYFARFRIDVDVQVARSRREPGNSLDIRCQRIPAKAHIG